LNGHIRGEDFSNLVLRQVYLQALGLELARELSQEIARVFRRQSGDGVTLRHLPYRSYEAGLPPDARSLLTLRIAGLAVWPRA